MLSADCPELIHRYFHLHLPPILAKEIQGDLTKDDSEDKASRTVRSLARRVASMSTIPCLDFRELLIAEAGGETIEMGRRPHVRQHAVSCTTTNEKIMQIADSEEEEMLHKWRSSEYSDQDYKDSEAWREMKERLDWRDSAEPLKQFYSPKTKAKKSLEEVIELVEDILASAKPHRLVTWLLWQWGFTKDGISEFIKEWVANREGRLTNLPYMTYCIQISMAAHLGMLFQIFGQKKDNLLDLEYLMYLPFTQAFSTCDKFQAALARSFMKKDQAFVPYEELATDLRRIRNYLAALSDEARSEDNNFHGPPELADSLCHKLWKQFMRSDYRANPRTKLSDDQVRRMKAHLNRLLDTSKNGVPDATTRQDDCDLIWRHRTAHMDDPCPCMSGKTLGDCHGRRK
ncbi:MAG: hypothetical protein CJBNEKGG_02988 [Prosthecobacter sp.]|nr:hypothetical protein [Prosthecobacter sp.]